MEQDQLIKEVLPVQRCSSLPGTAGFSANPFPLFLRHALIFGHRLPNTIFFSCPADHLSSQSTIASYHTPYPLDVDLSPVCWRPPTPGMILLFITTPFEPLVALKNKYARHGVIFMPLLRHFKCMWWSFSPKEFRFMPSSVLVIGHSENRGSVNKSMWKNWMAAKKAKLTVIDSLDIMLDDNIICLSLFRP